MKNLFNRLVVTIVSLVIIAGAGFAVWHFVVQPAKEELEALRTEYDGIKQYDEAKLAQTRTYKEQEFAKLELDVARYQDYMNRFMPMLDFSRRDTGMISYWHETTGIGSTIVTNFARKDPVVTVNSATINVPAAPTNPNDSLFDQDIITYTGSVSVTGDFRSILDNIVRWSRAPRLVLVDPSITMNMSGSDPNSVSASYNFTCYVFPRATGGSKIQLAPGGGAAAASTGTMGGGTLMGPTAGMTPPTPSGPTAGMTPPSPSMPSAPATTNGVNTGAPLTPPPANLSPST